MSDYLGGTGFRAGLAGWILLAGVRWSHLLIGALQYHIRDYRLEVDPMRRLCAPDGRDHSRLPRGDRSGGGVRRPRLQRTGLCHGARHLDR